MREKLKWMAPILLFILTSSVIGIDAYFADSKQITNEFIVGEVKTKIAEDFVPPKELTPGTSFTKDVKVENVGISDAFVRIKAVFTDSDMEKYCTVDWNTVDYDYNSEDGYYYYKEILKSGETTPSLFTTVTLSDAIPTEEIKEFDILVYMESYQTIYNNATTSREFTSYEEAWTYFKRNNPNS